MNYDTFLASKASAPRQWGLSERTDWNPHLKPLQRIGVDWALDRGRAALFWDCGLGKSLAQLEWARHIIAATNAPVLLLAPPAVAAQTERESIKFGAGHVTICRENSDVRPGINITNYERLERFDPDQFSGVVLDECFAPDTEIDTPTGKKPIQHIRIDDEIFNAAGVDRVADVHRREVPYAVKVTIKGRAIYCSPNHPYFTQRGWIGAQDLIPGDHVAQTATAMRLVCRHLHPEISVSETSAILREILLSEMAHESAGDFGEGACARGCVQARSEKVGLVSVEQSKGESRVGADSQSQPDIRPGAAGEDLPPIERDSPRTFRAWGKWARPNEAAAIASGCASRRLGGGIQFVTGQTDSRISNALQTRLSESRATNRYRGGWELPLQPQNAGRQEGRHVGFTRVDRLEVLEPGHPGLDRFRDDDGRIYFYDLGATRHPSFSVDGHLVHNSSILKSFMGATKRRLIEMFCLTPYRLCCSATPAPNDHVELGNHAAFLGVMPANEMLARFFINDTMAFGTWRLKGHAEKAFWDWVSQWALTVRRPSDLGLSDEGYELPALNWHPLIVPVDRTENSGQMLFRIPGTSAIEIHREMRLTAPARAAAIAELVNASPEQWALWCHTNYEADELMARIPDAIEVRGSMSPEMKEERLLAFQAGDARVLVTKARIAGYGLNFQNCHKTAFVGLSYSYEEVYQAVRRFWRYGQPEAVDAYVVTAETEDQILATIERKMTDHERMYEEMNASTEKLYRGASLELAARGEIEVVTNDDYTLYHGDCVNAITRVADNSVHFSVFSPPFSGLYIYSDSIADMGNCVDDRQFFEHFGHLIPEIKRVLIPGRLCAVHCKQLVNYKGRDGMAGLRDFRGDIIRAFTGAGFAYHSEVCIWKDPVIEMQRTKAHGLLYKQLRADSTFSRQGMSEYLLLFRKWPESEDDEALIEPVTHTKEDFPLAIWQRYASPVWDDIRQTNVLNVQQAREDRDEKHIAPLQLDVIERALELWTNPGDVVLSPFAGIGSEGYVSLQLERRFIGMELKRAYFDIMLRNLESVRGKKQLPLFATSI